MNDVFMLACPLSSWDGDKHQCRWCSEPFQRPRRRWCSDECGKDAVAQHWFQVAAHAVRNRDQHRCTKCRTSLGILHVHHLEAAKGRHSKTSCIHHQANLVVLCASCHKQEHHPKPTTQPEPAWP